MIAKYRREILDRARRTSRIERTGRTGRTEEQRAGEQNADIDVTLKAVLLESCQR